MKLIYAFFSCFWGCHSTSSNIPENILLSCPRGWRLSAEWGPIEGPLKPPCLRGGYSVWSSFTLHNGWQIEVPLKPPGTIVSTILLWCSSGFGNITAVYGIEGFQGSLHEAHTMLTGACLSGSCTPGLCRSSCGVFREVLGQI